MTPLPAREPRVSLPPAVSRLHPPSATADDQSAVFALLSDPAAHGLATAVSRIDTHGAVVFLAGQDVYKVKRAVCFPFMDFSTLEKRRAACEAEIVVNKANAPGIYLGVVPITRGRHGLVLGGEGEPIEWAVHMRRFDENATLDEVVAREAPGAALIARLAETVVQSHERAPRRAGDLFVDNLDRYIVQNRDAFQAQPELFDADAATRLTCESQAALQSIRRLILSRAKAGHVRRCHGDLHLRNIALIEGEPVLFDAIEFDEGVATCDVLYDLAFLLMDMEERGLRPAANGLLNRYLNATGEAHLCGLAALPLFLSVRAAIRAKVVAAGLEHLDDEARRRAEARVRRYFEMAVRLLRPPPARLVALGGLSGTGKSSVAAQLAPWLGAAPGAVLLRSDVERKCLFDVPETQRLPSEAYTDTATCAVYLRLQHKAKTILAAGHTVVVDAVHAKPRERHAIERIARALNVPFAGLWLEAPLEVRVQRVGGRKADASDADAAVVRAQTAYDPGPIDWQRIDASGPAASTLEGARLALGPAIAPA